MDSWERVVKTLNFESVDRLPVHGDTHNRAVIEYFGGNGLTEENMYEVTSKAARNIFDIAVGINYPRKPCIVREDGFVTEIQEWTSWIKKRPFSTSEECARDMRNFIKNTDPDNINLEKAKRKYYDWLELQRDFKSKGSIFGMFIDVGLQGIYYRFGMDLFVYTYLEHPDLVSKYIDIQSRYNLNEILSIVDPELSPLFELGSDIAFKNGLLFSPEFLRKEFIPYLERGVEAFHKKGVRVYLHSDGNLNQILDDLVATGIDGLHPVDPSSEMSLKEVREKFKDLFILGGIDGRTMAFATPEEVKKEVREAIEIAAPNYFVGVSGNIYEGIPVDNVKAMLEAVYEFK